MSGAGRVLVTGATGFIGGAVLRELASLPDGSRVRAVARSGPPGPLPPHVEWVRADVTRPGTLRGVAEGMDVLVHAASKVGGDEESCAAINVDGTRAVLAEARRCGVRRIVHLSTAAVYGAGPHRGPDVGELEPAPVSAASRTRLAGEGPARVAGAVVLRPGLVLGTGDRWVVPALAELLERVPVRWDGWRALLSVVDVGDLARLVRELALGRQVRAGVHHVAHPEPVRLLDLLRTLSAHGVLGDLPRHSRPWEECLELLRASDGAVSERQFSLLGRDHWYRSDAVWRAAACPPGPGPVARLAGAADWYRSCLHARGAVR